MIIKLYEQHGGIDKLNCFEINKRHEIQLDNAKEYWRYRDKSRTYFRLKCDEGKWLASTSYFIGIDWVIEGQLALQIQPKLNKNGLEVDYLKMLSEAMQDSTNFEHLEGLCYIDFAKSRIDIEQKSDILTPFLIIQFLQVVKQIVAKGLKRSYYDVTQNLNAKVKGKILVNQTIKKNIVQGQVTRTECKFQEFGLNNAENMLLKKALQFSESVIQNFKGLDLESVRGLFRYINPVFESVKDDIRVCENKSFKINPMFKEYEQAINLAKLILKRFSYNISNITTEKVSTPPFWIDMSKLFELYVFKKLRDKLPGHQEVIYHKKFHSQEVDFLINKPDSNMKIVVDAKYKPQYHEKSITTDDARQVCGYARLKSVNDALGLNVESDPMPDCLIIYSHQECTSEDIDINNFRQNEVNLYVRMYKLGVRLPQIASKANQ